MKLTRRIVLTLIVGISFGVAGLSFLAGKASVIRVDGAGATSAVRVCVFATGEGAHARMRVRAPDNAHHELALRATAGEALVADVDVPLVGGPAAGDWRLEVASVAGGGRIEHWSLRLRTDLDDKAPG